MGFREEASWQPIDPAKGYFVEEIGDSLYWVGDGPYQAMFLVGKDGVVLVDAPPSMGGRLQTAIAEVTDRPVTHVVYSHAHSDHAGGASLFDGAVFVAHRETARLLAREPRYPHNIRLSPRVSPHTAHRWTRQASS